MKIQQIRNAAIIVTYAGKKFLLDPWLAEKESVPPPLLAVKQDKRTPLVGLPIPLDEILRVDAVVVTHLHFDHFDDTAEHALPKAMPMFVQDAHDAREVRGFGFRNVTVLRDEGVIFRDVALAKTQCEHGQGEKVAQHYRDLRVRAEACGVVFSHPKEKTLYVAGDTVWCDGVREAIIRHYPDIIVLNAGDARFCDDPIIMGTKDVYEVCRAAPEATVVASHMEAVSHGMLTRKGLRQFITEKRLASQVLIPEDGETYTFQPVFA